MEIQGIDESVLSERSLVVAALEVKVGGVREGMDTRVCPAGDIQSHRVDRPQLPYRILLTDKENINEAVGFYY